MKELTKKELSEESEVFTAVWKVLKQYSGTKTETEFDIFIQNIKSIPKHFQKKYQFCCELLLVIGDYITLKNKNKEELQSLSEENKLLIQAWEFMKKFAVPESDDDWVIIVDNAKKTANQYNYNKNLHYLATHILLQVCEQIDKNEKERKMQEYALR